MKEIVYFELNHWSTDYFPNCEPYLTWMRDEVLQFSNQEWLKENKLVVVETLVDMSCNYCITAPRKWVEKIVKKFLQLINSFCVSQMNMVIYMDNLVVLFWNIQKKILDTGLLNGTSMITGYCKD